MKTPSNPEDEDKEYIIPPVTIPINKDEYTSLVIKASPIAMTGGSRDQREPTACETGEWIQQQTIKIAIKSEKMILLKFFS